VKTTNILGVEVACVGLLDILSCVGHLRTIGGRRAVFYVNAHCINTACDDAEYQQILNQADLVYCDGMGVVWASNMLGGCRLEKNTGADWIFPFCEFAEQKGISLYLLGGKPGVAKTVRQNLLNTYTALKIVGVSDGYFIENSEQVVLNDIKLLHPDVVLVGMGSPVQEKWISRHRGEIHAPVCWGVGALFDYVAEIEPRAPSWMSAVGLEWLWRLIVNPSGKWKRYLLGNPIFVYRVLMATFRLRR